MTEVHDGTAPALIARADEGSLSALAELYLRCAGWVENYGRFPPELRSWIAFRLFGIAETKKREERRLIECGVWTLLGCVPDTERGWLARSLRQLSYAVEDRTDVQYGIEKKLAVARTTKRRPPPGGDRLRIPRSKLEGDLARAIGLQREGEDGARKRTAVRDELIAESACTLLVYPSERFREFRMGKRISRSNAVDFAIKIANEVVGISHSTTDGAWLKQLRQRVLLLARQRGFKPETLRANGAAERTVADIVGSSN